VSGGVGGEGVILPHHLTLGDASRHGMRRAFGVTLTAEGVLSALRTAVFPPNVE
jgi:hypothetical protein